MGQDFWLFYLCDTQPSSRATWAAWGSLGCDQHDLPAAGSEAVAASRACRAAATDGK